MTFIQIILLILTLAPGRPQSNLLSTIDTPTFRLKYDKKIPVGKIQKVGASLETTYAEFRHKLGLSFGRRVAVYAFKNPGSFRAESKSPMYDDGFFKDRRIYLHVSSGDDTSGRFKEVLARVVSVALTGGQPSCPKWLSELYGMYTGNETGRFGDPVQLNVSTFSDLGEEFGRAKSEGDFKEVYAKLAATANFFATRYGGNRLDALLADFKKGVALETALEHTFGEKTTEIERAWVTSLRATRGR